MIRSSRIPGSIRLLATSCIVWGLVLLSGASVRGDEPKSHANKVASMSTVGVAAEIKQLVIDGSEIEAKPIEDRKSPAVVRVLATFRHGSGYRYDLEYYGLEPGQYDLRDFLQRKDRTSLESLSPILVEVTSRLPAGQIAPSSLAPKKLPSVGGYRLGMSLGIVAWLLITLWLVLGGHRRKSAQAHSARIPSLAEQMQPLVMEGMAGRLTPQGQAELERMLLGYWRKRLGLLNADPVAALTTLREHPEAGALLRLMEDWLYRPEGAGQVDIAAVLAPYQNLPDEDCDPTSGAASSGLTAVTTGQGR